jgi:hypothetical protein
MMNDERTPSDRLVPSQSRQLTLTSSALVRRGLADIARLDISTERIDGLRTALHNQDFDARAEAAKTIISLSPVLDLQRDCVASLLFDIVDQIHWLFMSSVSAPHRGYGTKYYPPGEEYRQLLMHALESMAGPIGEPSDAVIRAFVGGSRHIRLRAADWLGSHKILAALPPLREAREYTEDEELRLTSRWALSRLGQEDGDALCYDMVESTIGSASDSVKDRCRAYLSWPELWAPPERLARAAIVLGTDDDERNRRCAQDILYNSMRYGVPPIEECSGSALRYMLQLAWDRFLHISGAAELLPPPPLRHHDEIPTLLQAWVRRNRWALAWDYTSEIKDSLATLESILYEAGARAGHPKPTQYQPMPFFNEAVHAYMHGQSEAAYLQPDWPTRLGLQPGELMRTSEELVSKLGAEPELWDLVAALLDDRITKARTYHTLSALHHEKAFFLRWQGRDYLEELRLAARMRLLSFQSNGIKTALIITCNADNVCDNCRKREHTTLSIEDALATMPIPHEDCTSPAGYCRCRYFRGLT